MFLAVSQVSPKAYRLDINSESGVTRGVWSPQSPESGLDDAGAVNGCSEERLKFGLVPPVISRATQATDLRRNAASRSYDFCGFGRLVFSWFFGVLQPLEWPPMENPSSMRRGLIWELLAGVAVCARGTFNLVARRGDRFRP